MSLLLSCTYYLVSINPLNAELNPICYLLAFLGTHHIFHVSGLRVNCFITFTVTMLSINRLIVFKLKERCLVPVTLKE